ncbi:MAG: RNB domain-containing ribonuclease, partial [Caldilineaceae bacterium]|nr:RNB domain-containing ribonuclease [Caldilineaceae bacterium]
VGSNDPDDAISIDGMRLWVHVADVAALAAPDSPLDMEARARGGNLYLPEGTVHMLPPDATAQLALGLQDVSPALSIGIDVDEDGVPVAGEIVPSWVRVTRMSYGEAEANLDDPLLAQLAAMAAVNQARRLANGALELRLPEAKVRVEDGEVIITPLPPLASRHLVREAMLMAGEAVARFALEHEIPMLYTVQSGPDVDDISELQAAETTAEMFAVRRLLKPGRQRTEVSSHAGLGLDAYVQTTSPLRRYLDLVAHQQLRAYLLGAPLLDEEALNARLAAYRAVIGSIRQCERASNNHWTLVSLMRNPDWQGTAVVVEKRGARVAVIVEELALDAELYAERPMEPDQTLTLAVADVDLPQLEARFRLA